jgi:WD40 repeat protein
LPELEEVNETGTEVNPSLEMELSQSNGLESMLRLVSNKIKVDTSELLAEFKGEAELVIDGGGFMNEVSDVALDPNGRWVAASGAKVVRIWDVQSGELLETLRGDQSRAAYGDCHSLTFSPDGQFLCVGINDYQPHGSIRIYRTDNFADIDALLPGANSPTRKLQFSDDGKWLVTADAEGRVHLYDWESRGLMRSVAVADPQSPIIDELQFAQDNEANIVIFGIAANGPFLLSAPELERLTANSAMPDTMRSWMFDTLGRQLTLPFQTVKDPRVVELELPNDIWCSAGIGQVDGNSRYWVSLWPSRSMDSPIFKQPLLTYTGHKWNVTAVDLAPDLGWVASADKFGEVHLWQTSDGSLLHRFTCQGEPIYDAAFDSTSERIGFGTKSYRADQWDRNNFGSLEHLLDLRARSVFDIVAETEFIPIQETPFTSGATLDVIRPEGESSYSIVRKEKGSIVSAYQFTTGRNPTAFSFVEPGTLGVESPVLVSDSEGLFALWDSETDELKRAFIGHESLVSSISVAPAGNVVLTSSTDRTMRLWSLTDYKPTGIFDFKFENSVVKKIRPGSTSAEAGVRPGDQIVSIDELSMTEMQNLMLVGAFDYVPGDRVQVRLLRDGQSIEYEMQLDPGYDFSEPLLSVFIGDDDKWIMWSPLGYYDASPGAEELIGWHVNRGPDKSAQYFPVQQFRKQLYRPDIINQILGGKQVDKAVLMANADIDVDPIDFRSPTDLALYHPPKIEFESPRHNATIPSGDVDFTALVTSANGLPIREVTVLVNGVSEAVLIPPNPSAMKFRIDRSLRLEGGQNKIELIADNSESTSRLSIRVNVESTVPAKRIQLNILAIDTNSAGITADRFAQTLLQQDDNRLYSTVQTNVLQGRNATRDAILEGFQWLVDQTQPDDTAAVYISGTGYSDPDDLFFLGTHDIDPKRLRSTAVSWREFIDTIHLDLPRSKRLVFLDIGVTNASAQTASRNPLLDLATPELGTTFFSTNALQVANQSNRSNNDRLLTTALDRLMGDPRSDTEPRVGDSLLSNREVTESWSRQMKSLSNGQLYPIAFVNPSSERLHVLELTVE